MNLNNVLINQNMICEHLCSSAINYQGYLCLYNYRAICQMSRVFANGPGDCGSIQGQFIPKTQKMVLDAALFNTQHYKVHIKSKVEQSR